MGSSEEKTFIFILVASFGGLYSFLFHMLHILYVCFKHYHNSYYVHENISRMILSGINSEQWFNFILKIKAVCGFVIFFKCLPIQHLLYSNQWPLHLSSSSGSKQWPWISKTQIFCRMLKKHFSDLDSNLTPLWRKASELNTELTRLLKIKK